MPEDSLNKNDNLTKMPDLRLGYWAIWQVLIPFFVIAVFWPVHHFLLKTTNSFYCAFSSGDLVLFSALLLAGVAVEGKQIETLYTKTAKAKHLDMAFEFVRALSFITILGYGIMKYDLLRRGVQVDGTLQAGLAYLNLAITFFAVALSFYVLTTSARLTYGGN